MKHFLYIILLFIPLNIRGQAYVGVIASSSGVSVSSIVLPNLTGSWELNESTGAAIDEKGSNDLALVGSVSQHFTGKVGYAYSFDAANNSYIGNIATTFNYTDSLSISFWINTSSVGWTAILGNLSNNLGYDFLLTDGGLVYFRCLKTGANDYAITGSAVNTGVWTQIVGTYNGSVIRLCRL